MRFGIKLGKFHSRSGVFSCNNKLQGINYFHTSKKLYAMEDLYSLLGVPKNATQEEIKATFYSKAKQYHPDLPENKDNMEMQKKFQEISSAYDVLGDEKKRKKYDNFGLAGGDMNEEEIFGKFSAAMEEMMGKGEDFHRGTNIEVPIDLTFEEAALGTEKFIDYVVRVECQKCKGLATQPGHFPTLCESCNGKGFISTGKGLFLQRSACLPCGSAGSIVKCPCKACSGRGTVPKNRKLKVKIPAGVDHGHQVKLEDKGNEGDRKSGKIGSLFLVVNIKKHPFFQRDGNNVHLDAAISVSQAILGDTIKVHTLGGLVELKVPAGIQPGEKRILRGKGIHDEDSLRPGDQYVHFKVIIPKTLTQEQRELMTQFSKSEKIVPQYLTQSKWRTFLDKLRSYFWS